MIQKCIYKENVKMLIRYFSTNIFFNKCYQIYNSGNGMWTKNSKPKSFKYTYVSIPVQYLFTKTLVVHFIILYCIIDF